MKNTQKIYIRTHHQLIFLWKIHHNTNIYSTSVGWWNSKVHICDFFHCTVCFLLFFLFVHWKQKSASAWVFCLLSSFFIKTINTTIWPQQYTVYQKEHGSMFDHFYWLKFDRYEVNWTRLLFFAHVIDLFTIKPYCIMHTINTWKEATSISHPTSMAIQFHWLRSFKQLNCIKCTSIDVIRAKC